MCQGFMASGPCDGGSRCKWLLCREIGTETWEVGVCWQVKE
jgi:hypothetical protein